MKTIFNIFFLLLPLKLYSENIIVKSFEIENRNQQISFVNAKASALANRNIRDNAYLFFIDLKDDNKFYGSCWMKYIVNRNFSIDVEDNRHKLVKKTRKIYLFEVYLDPAKIRVKGINKNSFKKFCSSS